MLIPVRLGNFPILGYTETHKGLKTPVSFWVIEIYDQPTSNYL